MVLHPPSRTIAARQDAKVTEDGYLVADSCLVHLEGNSRPYFSVTGTLWTSAAGARSGSDRYYISGGCIHEDITAAFPELAPVVALHLADDDGAPMYAVENGWYYMQQGEWDSLARHLRVPYDALPHPACVTSKDLFVECVVNTERKRWKREAAAALAIIKREV